VVVINVMTHNVIDFDGHVRFIRSILPRLQGSPLYERGSRASLLDSFRAAPVPTC